jgi:hypothetical protein
VPSRPGDSLAQNTTLTAELNRPAEP